jgi:hypothetical protein
MTPDEHRREATRLRRDFPNDPEAQGSATAHEQIAYALELSKRYGYLLFALVAFGILFAAAHYLGSRL